MRNSRISMIAMIAATTLAAFAAIPDPGSSYRTPRRNPGRRGPIQRNIDNTPEIEAHNAAVDARKAAKKARRG